jgi:hypothetical protein
MGNAQWLKYSSVGGKTTQPTQFSQSAREGLLSIPSPRTKTIKLIDIFEVGH